MSDASYISILLFFVYTWGLGFSASFFTCESKDWFERNVMRIGYGIGCMIVLATLMNLLKIPLVWWVFLILALSGPVYYLFKHKKISKPDLRLTKTNLIYLALILIFVFNAFAYIGGSFKYDYLEDTDPYAYAEAMKYVSVEHKLDYTYFRAANHLDPYPPAHAIMMGIPHQTSPHAQWTLKFFNALIICLSFFFFFFMVNKFVNSKWIALSSTFILSMLPSYLSHFIWSHILIPTLFFVLIYCYEMMHKDKRWIFVTSIITAALFLTHITNTLKVLLMAFFYFVIKSVYYRKLDKNIIISTILGFIISLSWWAFKYKGIFAMGTSHEETAATKILISDTFLSFIPKFFNNLMRFFSPTSGTATRAYTFSDFFVAKYVNMINSPIGLGVVVSLLVLVGLGFIVYKFKDLRKKENLWISVVLVWLAFTFLGVNSETFNLPVGIVAFRFWMLLAIPIALLAAYAINLVMEMKIPKVIRFVIIALLLMGVFFTSGVYKYGHNTNPNWPADGKWSYIQEDGRVYSPELDGYLWIKNNLPIDSKIFTYGPATKVLYAMDMFPCTWCDNFREFKEGVLLKDMDTVYSWLHSNGYEYLVFGAMEYKYLGRTYGEKNATIMLNSRVSEIQQMPDKFKVVHQTQAFVLFKVI